jgi:hypothetical protein
MAGCCLNINGHVEPNKCVKLVFFYYYMRNIRNFWRRSIIRSCDADVDDTPCSEFHFACWSINFAFQFVSSSSFQIFSIFQFEYFLVGGWAFSLTDDRLKMCAGPGLYWGMLNGCVTMETCITAVSYCHFFFFFLFLKEKITLTKESKKPRAYWIPFPGHIEKENMEKTALKF